MKKIPWTGIGIGCIVLVVLVIGRCAVTAGRVLYYGGEDWMAKVMEDPWVYVGIAASALSVMSFILTDRPQKQAQTEEA